MWHEARRSERKVHDLMDAARKRAQKRAVFLAKRRGDPHQSLQVVGSKCRVHRDDGLFQAAEDQQGLIPWNGKLDILIDRFDGRALLDFIRDADSRRFRQQEKTLEEEEVEEFVNFERYRDLIKHRRRGFSDADGLQHANVEIEARIISPFMFESQNSSQVSSSKGSYSQVGFSYNEDGNGEIQENSEDEDEDDDGKDFSSDDSNDQGLETIAKEFGVKRYNWLLYMDKKVKEEEKRQKEIIKGDPNIRKLSRKERRKASQIEREKEKDTLRSATRVHRNDPYRDLRRSPTYDAYPRSHRSRSRSPSHSRRHDRGRSDSNHRSRSKTSKIEYITEFGGTDELDDKKHEAYSPPLSPPLHAGSLNCPSGVILEALHTDPANIVALEQGNFSRTHKPSVVSSPSFTTAKLFKTLNAGSKLQETEKKETPQERLKRIMSKQLNKQIKKDSAVETAKKREQERIRREKLAETSRLGRYRQWSRSRSRSPSRRRRHSRSLSRSPRRYYSRSHSLSHSPRARDSTRR
ncbi:putative Splicing factor, arginine/serine-rich [Zostera marina]|uniref:Putative Splicing factor, arginine/serine-rich n=1 Tax=Zostera marina TaxID=29655 RepID=A0A0K9NYB3_ZOSMR|nr:putative Splicing factor, arginine/serine-rich [Zostera marina]